jgi:type VI secretion system protein ImpL
MLTEMYKNEYVGEWRRFIQGVTVAEFATFDDAVQAMNRLGDPSNSPIRVVMQELFDQTTWDNPSVMNAQLARAQTGFVQWFKSTILRMSPTRVEVSLDVTSDGMQVPLGPIGREFAPLARVMMTADGGSVPMQEYLKALAKVRTRYNEIRNQGDTGPEARKLVGATVEGGTSEFGDVLRIVEEKMLTGMTASARESIRPILVRPLQQALAALVPLTEAETNRRWTALVYEPYQKTLAAKYPFDPGSRVEATAADIYAVFGAGGSIAKFASEGLAQLVNIRGQQIESRNWGDVAALRLRPEFVSGYPRWVSVDLGGGSAAAAGGGAPAAVSANQTVFEIMPLGAPGLTEYTLVIDGQQIRHRNTAAEWTRMVYPNPAGVAGVRLSGINVDGQAVEFFAEPGASGLDRWLAAAQIRKVGNGANELTFTSGRNSVSVQVRLVSQPGAVAAPAAGGTAPAPIATGLTSLRGLKLPATVAGGEAATGEVRK